MYYNANYDTLKAYRDDYYEVNRDTVLAQKQTYYEANREEIKHKVRSRRPSRRAESIQKEQERREQKHDQYLANSQRAAEIDLVRPIVRTLELITDTLPSTITPLLAAVPTVAGKHVFRPTSGVLYTLARHWPCDAAPANETTGVSYFLLLRERAEPTYLAQQSVAASSAPALFVIERRAVPRKVVNHAQALLRTMAARVSPLVPAPLREAARQSRTGTQCMATLYPGYVDRILNEARAQGCRQAEQAAAASRCFDLLTLFPEHQAASNLVFSLFCTPRLIDELRYQLAKTIPDWDERPYQQRQRLGTIFTWLSRWDKHAGMDMRLPPDDVADTLQRAQRILTLSHALGDEHSADLAWPLLTKAFAQTHAPQHARAWAAMVLVWRPIVLHLEGRGRPLVLGHTRA